VVLQRVSTADQKVKERNTICLGVYTFLATVTQMAEIPEALALQNSTDNLCRLVSDAKVSKVNKDVKLKASGAK
jgi:hypothetical protein